MVQLQEKKALCQTYKKQLLDCLQDKLETQNGNVYKLEEIHKINQMIDKYCYNSFSNKDICSSVNACGVTLK